MTDSLDRLTAALARRYRLERELGQGGMATVYLAEDLKHHRRVAVKVLRPELAATLGPERFAREIEVAARLQHPHILGVLDSGDTDGFFYYVMPYVEGETLRDRLARAGELPVPEAVRLLSEIAEALAVAHKAGVVHRDIKPENVLLSGRHALVMDFGVAKAVTEASGRQQLTTAGVALGTPAYMAPEQASADPQMDGRVDIYALGVLGYEMLTGHTPFHGLTPQQTLGAHVTQAPTPVGQQRSGLSPALEGVVMKCLAKRPADRFQTADELVALLEPLGTPSGGMTPTHTRPHAAVSGAAVPLSSARLRWAAVAAVVLVIGSAMGWKLLHAAGGNGSIQRIGVLPIEDISGKDAEFVVAMHDALTNALAQQGKVGVAPRSTMVRYKGSPKTVKEIAAAEGLDAVVETTVFRAGEVMRINVQFSDPVTTRSLWASTYSPNVNDVLKAQSAVVEQIKAGIDSVLGGKQTPGAKP
ncbi:MAG TPA: serine/threonine-protein kinase [Gemmatimonadales bacterium]|nr:serine/threonine-protein kinase [Gemmatimonadales bacterium]